MKTIMPVAIRLAGGCVAIAVAASLAMSGASAQTPAPGAREVPAKNLPAPDTVSPQLQKIVGATLEARDQHAMRH